jgi:hypothetical protein
LLGVTNAGTVVALQRRVLERYIADWKLVRAVVAGMDGYSDLEAYA